MQLCISFAALKYFAVRPSMGGRHYRLTSMNSKSYNKYIYL